MEVKNYRQIAYWQLMERIFSQDDTKAFAPLSAQILDEIDLPKVVLQDNLSIASLVQRYPKLKEKFDTLLQPQKAEDGKKVPKDAATEVSEAFLYSKLLYDIFGKLQQGAVSAGQYSDWTANRDALQGAFQAHNLSEKEVGDSLEEMEADLIKRMKLREVLADNDLAAKLSPNMSLIEELLRDKSNLEDLALVNAKRLIQQFVNQVAEVLKTQVAQAPSGKIDYSVPPKRVYRNLDLDRTIWKNLTNYNPKDGKLYVDNLYYKHTAKKNTPSRLIVSVDQSGSMVDSMVNCTILASIFAGLPKIDPHLVAYDTQAIDLTDWIRDPFEVLMRTKLGGGTDGMSAVELVKPKIVDPQNTVVVWISDFYEWKEKEIFNQFKIMHESGVKFIPVGSVTSSKVQYLNPWFKTQFKQMGTPVISGKIEKLIQELKNFLT